VNQFSPMVKINGSKGRAQLRCQLSPRSMHLGLTIYQLSSLPLLHWHAVLISFFGKYSCGLYVLHPFVLEQYSSSTDFYKRLEFPETIAAIAFIVVGIALSVVPALLSWHLLEKRFLGFKRFFEAKQPSVYPTYPMQTEKSAV